MLTSPISHIKFNIVFVVDFIHLQMQAKFQLPRFKRKGINREGGKNTPQTYTLTEHPVLIGLKQLVQHK